MYRTYVEREEAHSVKLYVTNLEAADRGTYKCLRMQGNARREEKTVSLIVFSQSHIYCAFITVTACYQS